MVALITEWIEQVKLNSWADGKNYKHISQGLYGYVHVARLILLPFN